MIKADEGIHLQWLWPCHILSRLWFDLNNIQKI